MVFSHHQIDIYVRKVMGGWGGVGWLPEKLQCQPQSQSLSSGFGTLIWDLDLGLGFGTELDNFSQLSVAAATLSSNLSYVAVDLITPTQLTPPLTLSDSWSDIIVH